MMQPRKKRMNLTRTNSRLSKLGLTLLKRVIVTEEGILITEEELLITEDKVCFLFIAFFQPRGRMQNPTGG